ncbi:50S ribosomal protein L22 [Patescibacteria group bacterium]|nr:50S ribosomal protein L22 [Patescibacteria group bacterium]MBU1931283.1 50S ribosomal protein L22 [Patescibacteria group bacterium]
MLIKARQSNIRTSPRKLALVARAVRALSLTEAMDQLKFMPKRAAQPMLKLFKQAIANAKDQGLDEVNLKTKLLEVKKGPTYKRWRPVSRGRAHSIKKRTSHIILTLEGEKTGKIVKPAVSKIVKPIKPIKPVKLVKRVKSAKPKKGINGTKS